MGIGRHKIFVTARRHYKNPTMPRFGTVRVSVCAACHGGRGQDGTGVSIGYKASAFDNVRRFNAREKPLRDKDLTASIEVNS